METDDEKESREYVLSTWLDDVADDDAAAADDDDDDYWCEKLSMTKMIIFTINTDRTINVYKLNTGIK